MHGLLELHAIGYVEDKGVLHEERIERDGAVGVYLGYLPVVTLR